MTVTTDAVVQQGQFLLDQPVCFLFISKVRFGIVFSLLLVPYELLEILSIDFLGKLKL